MDTECAEKNTEHARGNLGFIGHALIELTVCILLEGIGCRIPCCALTERRSIRVCRTEGRSAGLLKRRIRLNLLEAGLLYKGVEGR